MKKKIILQMAVLFVCCANVFALLLPNGDNVRVNDVKQNGDAIIEAKLSQNAEITTPLGKLPATGTVHFYESGAIKSLKLPKDTRTTIESPIGTITISRGYRDDLIEFYESGCPKHIYLDAERDEKGDYKGDYNYNYNYPTITVNGITTKLVGNIYFWDSKNPNEWICKEFEVDEDITVAVNNTNIVVPGGYENKITFYSNGQIEYISRINAPKEVFKTPIGDVWLKDYRSLSFHDDGSLKSFCTDELLQVKIDNKNFNIPSGEYVYLYKNGVPKMFKASNAQTIKILNYTYEIRENSAYIFSKEGKIKQFSGASFLKEIDYDARYFVDTFYTDGSPKRIVQYDAWDWKGLVNARLELLSEKINTLVPSYSVFFTQDNRRFILGSDGCYFSNNWNVNFYLQKGDYPSDVAMVYFSDNWKPVSYKTYKTDENGAFLFDEDGFPIIDDTKKYFK